MQLADGRGLSLPGHTGHVFQPQTPNSLHPWVLVRKLQATENSKEHQDGEGHLEGGNGGLSTLMMEAHSVSGSEQACLGEPPPLHSQSAWFPPPRPLQFHLPECISPGLATSANAC